jgi:anti-sigma factor RsiW
MDCKTAREFITLYIDGMLDESDKLNIEAHLEECRECYKRFAEIKEVVTLLGELGEENVPDGFSKRLRIQLEAQQQISRQSNKGSRGKDGSYHWVKWVGMAAALAVIVLSIRMLGVLDLRNKAAVSLDESAANGSAGSVAIQDSYEEVPKIDSPDDQSAGYEHTSPREIKEQNSQSINGESVETGEDTRGKGETKQETDSGISPEENTDDAAADYIRSDVVELKVQDICVTPHNLMTKILQYDINILDVDENSLTLQFTDNEQRRVLYKELKMLGTVSDTGEDFSSDNVTIVIIHNE